MAGGRRVAVGCGRRVAVGCGRRVAVGKAYEHITEPMRRLVADSKMFFVATAPSSGGRVNVSPKGYESFAILDDNTVAYADITGSGAETIAHLRDDGRITFMFCAFDGPPNIVRFQGRGRAVFAGEPDFEHLVETVGRPPGLRSVIVADIDRTSTSCGYAVPFMEYVEDRPRLADHWADATADELDAYHRAKNAVSIDGLPGVP